MQNNFKEIERKYLVDKENKEFQKIIEKLTPQYIVQGYLIEDDKKSVVRVRKLNDDYFLTIKINNKNNKTDLIDIERNEFEFPIDTVMGENMLKLCNKFIVKTRYKLPIENGLFIEIDFFENGLVLAEVEVKKKNQKVNTPIWIIEEVSHDPKYYNNNMAQRIKI